MELNQNAKQKFSRSFPAASAALRITGAVFIFITALVLMISGFSETDSMYIGASSGYISASIFIACLPFFILSGMGILWGVSFFRANNPESNGRILASASVSSLTTSCIGAFLCLPFIISLYAVSRELGYEITYREGRRESSKGLSDLKFFQAMITLTIIMLFIGIITLILTSVARKLYYSSVEETFKNESDTCTASALYMVMKIFNMIFRTVIIIMLIISLAKFDEMGEKMKGWGVTAFVFIFISLTVGIFANLAEALMVVKYSKSLYNTDNAVAYSVPYGNIPYRPMPAPNPYNASPLRQDPVQRTVAADNYDVDLHNCPFCGAPENGTSRFCMKCGGRLR